MAILTIITCWAYPHVKGNAKLFFKHLMSAHPHESLERHTGLSLINRRENTEVRWCFKVPQTQRWGSSLALSPFPRSQPQHWDSLGCLPGLWQPNIPVCAALLLVFRRFLSPKLLSLLAQRVSPFFSKWAQRTITGMVTIATLTRHLMAMKYVLALVISEDLRLQTARVLIWKRQKLLSEHKIPQSKWGEEENILRCIGWRGIQPLKSGLLGSWHPRGRGGTSRDNSPATSHTVQALRPTWEGQRPPAHPGYQMPLSLRKRTWR